MVIINIQADLPHCGMNSTEINTYSLRGDKHAQFLIDYTLMFRTAWLFVLLSLSFAAYSQPHQPKTVYESLCLESLGLPRDAWYYALKGWGRLRAEGSLQNPDILSIADFSQSSNNKRLYIIDLRKRTLLFNTYVAHGRNTGQEYAKFFSNEPSSFKSSLGFYVTAAPIVSPKHGLALTIRGVEQGINSNAERREIIIHAADYCTPEFIKKYGRLGRSYGCPAIPPEVSRQIIDTIKNGSCLFIYQADKNYLTRSALLK
jgi:hypothetical protein